MLEKFSKKMQEYLSGDSAADILFDAHFHYAVCKEKGLPFPADEGDASWTGISCAHSIKEFEIQSEADKRIFQSYGMHPQNAENQNIKESSIYLERLINEKKICFIGEAGFDYFTEDFKKAARLQEEIWNIQLELALHYKLPMVIHCRKANHKLFEYSKDIKKLPEVIFHSFMGPAAEAQSLLKHGINGYFSFGKQLLNGNKKTIECVKTLPADRLLAETDAPFQYLKGQSFTLPAEIKLVYEAFKSIRQ